jgi:hypothetical protein
MSKRVARILIDLIINYCAYNQPIEAPFTQATEQEKHVARDDHGFQYAAKQAGEITGSV